MYPPIEVKCIFSLLQREKVADVSAKQIYDRLRSSRMTDEVLLTVFVNYN